jgi:SpoVK/Ycf46/Vps4 family AAA+-type ATPase
MTADIQAAFHRFLARGVGLVFVGAREIPVRFNGPSVSVDVTKPTAAEQFEAWTALLREHDPERDPRPAAERLAGQFDLNLGDIREVALATWKGGVNGGDAAWTRLWDACRDRVRPRLDSLAQRLDVKATWDDLVLPDEQMVLMRQIAGQVRERHTVYGEWGFGLKMNRGFGITALFSGESGTGKTMAAEVIANDLRLNLYRIDLSAVVSKYIGETEKNLRKLFDVAEEGGAILFFDEADALFGKRSEVKDSHDRYANIEINYLLQRMEAFSGLAILATNMKSALDPAFMRRLRFIVNFQFPGVTERKLIWERALPRQTPKEALDYDRLARLNITGGNIHSIAVNAAFLAATNRTPVTMPLLLTAARTELRKLEKPFSEAEFR